MLRWKLAHSFVPAHEGETLAFEHFAHAQPDNVVLLIDTYDTKAAASKVVALAPQLEQQGIRIKGVRIDSGNLADHARRKRSEGKQTWPGRKQVYRNYDAAGRMALDVVTVEGDAQPGEPLLKPVMRGGQRIAAAALADTRSHAATNLALLPEPLRRLQEPYDYRVEISAALHRLAEQVDLNVESGYS